MKLGMMLRNSGPASSAQTIAACARAADEMGLDDLWTIDHIAIPPDQAEGSGGRYVDPLATLAFVAGFTQRVGLGVSVLVLPYRAALPTAKWVASIQELSSGRLTLGVGAGWMAAEFKATGVAREQRGQITDQTLAFFHECFLKRSYWEITKFTFSLSIPKSLQKCSENASYSTNESLSHRR